MSVTACGEAGTTITRLAVGDPGPDPYTLAANADDDERVDRRAEAGGQMKGDAPGLYGGTRETSSCDKNALVRFLQVNADKAEAWAGALSIRPGEISAFVADLTPAVLRVDTLVTNHGYREGAATSMPAVLQAGVAVLVDRKGVPVVKCNCGNPLTPPAEEIDPKESDYRGASWPQFNDEKVTVIETPGQEVESLTLVDSETETAFERPVGTGGDRDGRPEPIPSVARSEPPVSTSGQQTGTPSPGGTTGAPTRDGGTPGTPGEQDSPTDSASPAGTPEEERTEESPASEPAAEEPEQETPAAKDAGTATGPDSGAADPPSEPAGTTQTQEQEPQETLPQEPQTQEPQTQSQTRPRTPEASKPEEPRSQRPEPGPGPEATGG